MTIKQYLSDVKGLTGSVTVTEILLDQEKPIIRTAQTWFHPQGGGQKADRGTIGNSNVLHVAHNAGYVDHYVDKIDSVAVGMECYFSVNAEWRRINSAFHTAGHLIAAVIDHGSFGVRAVSGHQWPGEARVEFEGDLAAVDAIQKSLPAFIEEAIRANLSVRIQGDPSTDRSIQIGEYAAIPCGGTHVRSLGEIAQVSVLSVKKKGKRIRVSYEAAPQLPA